MMRTSLRAGIGPVREAKIVPPASCSPMRTEKTALILPAWPEKKRITAERDRDKTRKLERERGRGDLHGRAGSEWARKASRVLYLTS